MFTMWEYKEQSCQSISLRKLIKDLMALMLDERLFHKCAPLLVAEATFKKIGTGLRQSQFVFNISKSMTCAEGFKQAFQVLQRLIIQRSKHQFQFLLFSSDIEIIPSQLTTEHGSAKIVVRLKDNLINGVIAQIGVKPLSGPLFDAIATCSKLS